MPEEIRKILVRTASYIKPYLFLQFTVLIITLISTLISLSLPYFLKIIIDDIIIKQKIPLLQKVMGFFIFLLIINAFLSFLHAYFTSLVSNKIMFNTNKEIYTHLLKLPVGYFSRSSVGETMSKIINDIGALQSTAQNFFINFLFDFLNIVVIIGILFYLSSSLAIMSLITMPFFALSPKIFAKKLYKESKLIQEKLAIITKALQETLSGIYMIKAFLKEKQTLEKYKSFWEDFLKLSLRRTVKKSLATEIVRSISFLGPLTVLWYGGWLCSKEIISIGTLVAFYSYLLKLYSPLSSIINSQLGLSVAAGSISRIFAFLDEIPEESEIKDDKIRIKYGSIEFVNVNFEYEDRNFRLHDINFSIEAGSKIGIVGASGAGKTTLINLLCKYYPLKEGRIKIDGYNIDQLSASIVRREIGVIPQEPFLFNTTILENFLFAKESASIEEIEEVCKIAQIYEFILSLPNKFDTIIGDRGMCLSIGQKQRLAIAMVLLKNPKILIFDEATSAIDSKTEKRLFDSLFKYFNEKTIIIIAHRLSNLNYVDNIIVLENGKIVEKGLKSELLRREGFLKSYFKHQYKLYDSEEKEVKSFEKPIFYK